MPERISEAGLEAALLPCPFCNSTNLIRSEGERRDDGLAGAPASIICIGCDGRMFGYDLQKAAAAWNRRASLPAPQGPALARYGQAIDQWLQCLEGAGTWDARTLERVRICIGPILDEMIASTPAPQGPAAQVSEAVLPDDNDGIEQDAFEEWAKSERFDMERHQLYWLFLNSETSAARRGWRAGIRHARDRYKAMLAAPQPSPDTGARAKLIEHMVNRFLSWKLPEPFRPDGGIYFEPRGNPGTAREYKREPTGTNLLDATQARAMVTYMLDGFPTEATYSQAEYDEVYEIGKRDGYEDAVQEIDLATGGDGEFKGSTSPGETVDVPAMKARIIQRCYSPDTGAQPVTREAVKAAIRKGLTDNLYDLTNARKWDADLLLAGCTHYMGKGYEKPSEAADHLAGDAADAVMALYTGAQGAEPVRPVAVEDAITTSLDGLPTISTENLHYFAKSAPAPFDAPTIRAMARELLAFRFIAKAPLFRWPEAKVAPALQRKQHP